MMKKYVRYMVIGFFLMFVMVEHQVNAAWNFSGSELAASEGGDGNDEAAIIAFSHANAFIDFLKSAAGNYFLTICSQEASLKKIIQDSLFGNFDDSARYENDIVLSLHMFLTKCSFSLTERELGLLLDALRRAYAKIIMNALEVKEKQEGIRVTDDQTCWLVYWLPIQKSPHTYFFNELVRAENKHLGIDDRWETFFAVKELFDLLVQLTADSEVGVLIVGFLRDKGFI